VSAGRLGSGCPSSAQPHPRPSPASGGHGRARACRHGRPALAPASERGFLLCCLLKPGSVCAFLHAVTLQMFKTCKRFPRGRRYLQQAACAGSAAGRRGATRGDAGRACGRGQARPGVLHDEHLQQLRERGKRGRKREERAATALLLSPRAAVGPPTGAGPVLAWRPSCPALPHLPLILPASASTFPSPQPWSPSPRSLPGLRHAGRCRRPPAPCRARGWASLLSVSAQTPTSLGRIGSSQSTAFR